MKKRNFQKSVLLTAFTLCLAFSLIGCGQKGHEPVAINPQVDTCAECKMAVGDDSFAAELIQEDGTPHKFDDVGCLLTFVKSEGDAVKNSDRYVRDLKTKEWIRMDQAFYVANSGITTPMNYNIVSFKNKADAEGFIKENNLKDGLVSLDQLMQMELERK